MGWHRQQLSRNLSIDTINDRERIVRRFLDYTNEIDRALRPSSTPSQSRRCKALCCATSFDPTRLARVGHHREVTSWASSAWVSSTPGSAMTRILHLSDTHISATGPDEDGVDAVSSLERILHDVRHVRDIDVVAVSGDIADDGSAAGCDAVRERVGRFARSRGIPHIYSTGNHDSRDGFAKSLGSGHLNADGSQRGDLFAHSAATRTAVSKVGDLRVVTLDSLVPGETHGIIDAEQLNWLSKLLSTSVAGGTVLIFHHPPFSLESLPYTRDVVLQNGNDLADVVRGRDVRAILTGHLHFHVSGLLAGIPICVTPGVVTRIDTTAAPHLVRGVLGASATIVDIDSSGHFNSYLLTARDPHANQQVYVYDPVTGEDAVEPV